VASVFRFEVLLELAPAHCFRRVLVELLENLFEKITRVFLLAHGRSQVE
jgi:hypothetical protein